MVTGDDIVTIRTAHKLSRKKVAEATNLTEGKIWSIEKGRKISASEQESLQAFVDLLGEVGVVLPSVKTNVPVLPNVPLPPVIDGDQTERQWPPVTQGDTPIEPLLIPTAGGGPVPQEGVRLTSNSELQTFKDCRRKWWLAWYRGLKPKSGDSDLGVRAIGDRIHRALAMWYVPQGFTPMDPKVALERLIIDDYSAIARAGTITLEFQKKFDSEANLERAMMEGYLQWLQDEGEDADFEVIAPETYVEAEILKGEGPHPIIHDGGFYSVKLIGKLDVRVRRRSDGVIMFIDHKSVGDFIQPVRTLHLDEQMLRYHLLEWLNTAEGEKRCDAALYNMLRRVRRTANAKPPFFKRVTVHHNEHELQSILKRTRREALEMITLEQALNEGDDPQELAYPRPSRDCTWKCQFFAICGMFDDGSRVEAMIENYYTAGDPLAYYGTTTSSEGDA
jgi:hypothetical protein